MEGWRGWKRSWKEECRETKYRKELSHMKETVKRKGVCVCVWWWWGGGGGGLVGADKEKGIYTNPPLENQPLFQYTKQFNSHFHQA